MRLLFSSCSAVFTFKEEAVCLNYGPDFREKWNILNSVRKAVQHLNFTFEIIISQK